MNLIVAPILAILIGLFVRSKFQAVLLYLVIEALFFTYQTLSVLMSWMGGEGGFGGATEQGAFGPAPDGFPLEYSASELSAYGLVNLTIILVGTGLILLICWLRGRSRVKKHSVQVA
ncbi:hypothetical protein [Microbacterium soli]|uniref:Uncharacterized protein n=1 Tax=Microbacterium soli TaxID=446075 RepID=A0ABP7NEB6_9MICO